MRVSVSLPAEDVAFLDAYATEHGFASRSALLHKAVRLLRAVELSESYQGASTDWNASDDPGGRSAQEPASGGTEQRRRQQHSDPTGPGRGHGGAGDVER